MILPPDDPADLELPPEVMRAMGQAALERVVDFIASLPYQGACGDIHAEELCRALRESAPEHGVPISELLDRLFHDWIPRSFNTAGPGYLAYIPGGGIFPAALADLIADGTNRYTGIWQAAPALVQLEANVLDWFRDWMGFPSTTRGLFTTGGSMSVFNAVLCARERQLGTEIRSGVLYTSNQAHAAVVKSAKLAGIFPDRVRLVSVDSQFRMRFDDLGDQIARDQRAGLRPFLVVSTAGSTNTGAVDPLEAIADLCEREGLWHHVDGAYGAFFHLVEPLRPLLAGLSRADSLTLDPHKGLFLPYGTGALLVRDGAALRNVHQVHASYMPPAVDQEFYDPAQYGPELSRGFPGLRVWLTIKTFGAARIRAAIAEKRALAVAAAERLAGVPGINLVAPPQLSLLAFCVQPTGSSLLEQNNATSRLLERVNARRRVMLTGCTVDGRFLARLCVMSFRTRERHVELAVDQIIEEAAGILAEGVR
ncbi:MAG TPA: aminotransferase class V-fold PLP-dependent enzyme [Isosphaeraceae bacterium]|nr:aminotransferase class V-fold PLP-dependent enzyme [Isosphaeraceae bacterium]